MSQKSSVMQLPQFVPKALTSDTHKRDELLRDGRGEEMNKLVKAARDLQDSLLSIDPD